MSSTFSMAVIPAEGDLDGLLTETLYHHHDWNTEKPGPTLLDGWLVVGRYDGRLGGVLAEENFVTDPAAFVDGLTDTQTPGMIFTDDGRAVVASGLDEPEEWDPQEMRTALHGVLTDRNTAGQTSRVVVLDIHS